MRRILTCLAAAAVAACSDSTGTRVVQRNESDLSFLRTADDAPPLASFGASFWAVKGEDRELRLSYRPPAGSTDSTEFLRLRIRGESLFKLPNGLALGVGDSVLITVTVIDPARMIVELQPSGLLFSREEPAELEMRYREADSDYDDDGDVDAEDDEIERRLSIWRQERIGEPWVQIGTDVRVDTDEVRADLTGFTRYAIAY